MLLLTAINLFGGPYATLNITIRKEKIFFNIKFDMFSGIKGINKVVKLNIFCSQSQLT